MNATQSYDPFDDFDPVALFGEVSQKEVDAGLRAMQAAEDARLASLAAVKSANKLRPFCGRCGGAGFISAFAHRQGGVCFACGGSGNA